jgi:hypothetical protein
MGNFNDVYRATFVITASYKQVSNIKVDEMSKIAFEKSTYCKFELGNLPAHPASHPFNCLVVETSNSTLHHVIGVRLVLILDCVLTALKYSSTR